MTLYGTFATVTIHPGDWGRRYVPIKGVSELPINREVNRRACKKLLSNWSGVCSSVITLIRVGRRKFHIVDGQHRIYTASELRKTASEFSAHIYTPSDLTAMGTTVEDLVGGRSLQRSWAVDDWLRLYNNQSVWPAAFKSVSAPTPTFGGNLRWSSVIAAYRMANATSQNRKFTSGGNSRGRMMVTWGDGSDEMRTEAKRIGAIVKWWHPVMVRGGALKKRGTFLRNRSALSFAFLIYGRIPTAKLKDRMRERIFEYPTQLDTCCFFSKSASAYSDFVTEMVKLVNYRSRKAGHVTIFDGEDR